ncbi:MAG: hypothetical protein CM15mP101_07580 [Flavobacteriaceae bacterium]|nr:MAG: hypothetical protein CM15mP101_07580 [Flavobacteriaceae bacterium]
MYLAFDLKYKFTLKILKYFSLTTVLILCFISCKKDDDGSVDSIPANDYTEQHIIENDSIIDFMQNHFYNYEDFSNLATSDGPELIIDSIKGDNIDKISIYEQVSSLEINVKDSDGNLFPHTAYYVIIREGIGDNPTVADSVFVKYKGMLLNKDVFDQRNAPIWLQAKNVVRGFQEFVPLLKKGNINTNSDGNL